MAKLIMMKGLPGSGKTTWAKQQVRPGVKRVGKDDLRSMLDCGQWSKKNEKFVHRVQQKIIQMALEEGYDIVVDNTHLKKEHKESLMDMAYFFGTAFECKSFSSVPLETCITHDKDRDCPVGENVIRAMNAILQENL